MKFKKTHIVAMAMMIIAVVILFISSKDLSTYATFDSALNTNSRVKIVGQLSLEDPVVYEPEKDANQFSFYLIDQAGNKKKVISNEPKPRDFEKAEEIVVTGIMAGNETFKASEILTKCPSKYAEEKLELRNQS